MAVERLELNNPKNKLEKIKENVKKYQDYFEPNNKRYFEFIKFVYNSSLTEADLMTLSDLKKPQLEFNFVESYISRLCGEFSKQEPSIDVRSEYGAPPDPRLVDVVEGHFRHILCDAERDAVQYQSYRDILAGGFGVFQVVTEWANPMSMQQIVKLKRCNNPTFVGFDPLAKLPHKGDGSYAYELYPMRKEEFKLKYPKINIEKVSYNRSFGEFSWSYHGNKEDILLLCSYFEKESKEFEIAELANGKIVRMSEYRRYLKDWEEGGYVEAPLAIKGKPRKTTIITIKHYLVMEREIIEETETDFEHLPYIFIDGNSIEMQEGSKGDYVQMTRPYVYHARDAQRLINFAGVTLANELENIMQHKISVPIEAIPDSYVDAYTDIQHAKVLAYNQYDVNDPTKQLNPPAILQKAPAPPEVMGTFQMAQSLTQGILGTYDASLGVNNNQLSGVAIVEGATQSNAVAMPYIVNYMHALTQVAVVALSLIPKLFLTSQTMPIITSEGLHDFVEINKPGAPSVQYEQHALQIRVEAGVSFAIAKSRALNQIIAMANAVPKFGEFINRKGLRVILDNFEIRGIDQLTSLADQFMQEEEQEKQMQMQQMQMASQQMSQQQAPIMKKLEIEAQKAQMEYEIDKEELELKASKLDIEQQNADTARIDSITRRLLERDQHHHKRVTDLVSLHHKSSSAPQKVSDNVKI